MKGRLFTITAPSGAGKTTLVSHVLMAEPGLRLSVSHTTRAPRPGEIAEVHYHFVDMTEFMRLRDQGGFLEWAEVFGNYYGTSRRWIEEQLNTGSDILLEIDWQGAQQIRILFPQVITVFILPPSIEELKKRLQMRAQDSPDVIARRIAGAQEEISHVTESDYVIINNDLDEACLDLRSIIRASRLTQAVWRSRNPDSFSITQP